MVLGQVSETPAALAAGESVHPLTPPPPKSKDPRPAHNLCAGRVNEFISYPGFLRRKYLNRKHFFDLMITRDLPIYLIQRSSVEIPLTTLFADLRFDIFHDVEPPLEPMGLSDLLPSCLGITEFTFHLRLV